MLIEPCLNLGTGGRGIQADFDGPGVEHDVHILVAEGHGVCDFDFRVEVLDPGG